MKNSLARNNLFIIVNETFDWTFSRIKIRLRWPRATGRAETSYLSVPSTTEFLIGFSRTHMSNKKFSYTSRVICFRVPLLQFEFAPRTWPGDVTLRLFVARSTMRTPICLWGIFSARWVTAPRNSRFRRERIVFGNYVQSPLVVSRIVRKQTRLWERRTSFPGQTYARSRRLSRLSSKSPRSTEMRRDADA